MNSASSLSFEYLVVMDSFKMVLTGRLTCKGNPLINN